MIETRIVKIVTLGSLALFAGLVTFDNLTDYQTNYAFVRHVLSVDATPPGNALMYRSISSPSLWEAAYALIIAGEGATALGFAGAEALLLRHLRRRQHVSTAPKDWRSWPPVSAFLFGSLASW